MARENFVARNEKKDSVKTIKEKFERAKGVVVTDYRGLSVKEISDLRSELRKAGIEYKVYKNTLAGIAVKDADFSGIQTYLEGPSAFAFDYENEVEAAKILTKYAKDQKKLEIKGGVIEGNVVNFEAIKQYASLPSKDELIAKAIGSFAAPVRQVVTVVAAPLQGFINVLKARAEQA